MKKIPLLLLCIIMAYSARSQTSWLTNLNSVSGGTANAGRLGTVSQNPIVFYTNNQPRMTLGHDGSVIFNSIAGGGNKLTFVSDGGRLSGLSLPGTGYLLNGDGTFQFNPIAVTNNTTFYTPLNSKLGIGKTAPTVALDVAGDISSSGSMVSNNLTVKTLSASANKFMTSDGSGNISAWTGNTNEAAKVLYGDGSWKTAPVSINGANTYISSGKFGIGTSTPTVALQVVGDVFSSGAVTATNFRFDSNHGITYDGPNNTLLFGSNSVPHMAYNPCNAIPNYTANCWMQGESLGFVSAQSTQSIALMMFTKSNKQGYIEMNGDGSELFLNFNCGKNTSINTGANGGTVHIGSSVAGSRVYLGDFVNMNKHTEIGNPLSPINDAANIALDINASAGTGVRFNTFVDNTNAFTVKNNGVISFNVSGDGSTQIQTNNTDAFSIGYPGNGPNFEVYGDGKLEMTTNNSSVAIIVNDNYAHPMFNLSNDGRIELRGTNTNALSIYNGSNQTISFDRNGYTTINVFSPLGMPTPSVNPRVLTIRDMSGSTKDIFAITSAGKVYAREVEISTVPVFADYVFEKNYALKPIGELADYINENKHLPGFEKGEYYEKNGINVSDLLVKQQEKIEELILYIIALEKRGQKIAGLEQRLQALENTK